MQASRSSNTRPPRPPSTLSKQPSSTSSSDSSSSSSTSPSASPATLTSQPLRPTPRQATSNVSPNRPPLQRVAVGTTSSLGPRTPGLTSPLESRSDMHRPSASSSSDASSDELDQDLTPQARPPDPVVSPKDAQGLDLETLKKEMLLRLAQQKNKLTPSAKSQNLGARRISPIKEEPTSSISPTLEGAFASPMPTGQLTSSTSTESTGSSRTIKGSAAVTPALTPAVNLPLRTPSYPFPYVPGTPRTWSSSFHRPFTTLSPTVSSRNLRDTPIYAPADSEASTPAASHERYAPGESRAKPGPDDPNFPAPNLYDLILALSSEPGLESWWMNLAQTVHETYGVERMSLAVPADAGELENVPWGQKASFNFTGAPEPQTTTPTSARLSTMPRTPIYAGSESGERPPLLHMASSAPGKRPVLSNRHSYAGHERDLIEQTPVPLRPRAPSRTKSHAPQVRFADEPEKERDAVNASMGFADRYMDVTRKVSAFSDPDFSITGSEVPSDGPYTQVLTMLRALNFEGHALLDESGVNRILARGKAVCLTRDYSDTPQVKEPPKQSQPQSDNSARTARSSTEVLEKSKLAPKLREPGGGDYFGRPKTRTPYEEYEQFPSSPWAQSPAPSPAIQGDPDDNPFFAAVTGVDDGSFNPSSNDSDEDYSRFGQVPAIGIDQASTIIHLPLIHPILSQTIVSRTRESDKEKSRPQGAAATSGEAPGRTSRKAPIAILSLLSPIVPYPQSLLHSLQQLAPHLATSFSNAQLFSDVQAQSAAGSRTGPGNTRSGFSGSDSSSLDRLMEAELDSSLSGSLTSPSDYSGRSRHSPGGSIAGTPGSESGQLAFANRPSISSTPGVPAEGVDSYFEVKRRAPHSQRAAAGSSTRAQTPDLGTATTDLEDSSRSGSSGQSRTRKDDKVGPRAGRGSSPASTRRAQIIDVAERRQRSFLHSYGADFQSTYQTLPATAAADTARNQTSAGLRDATEEQAQHMPPPSERLLRTITDSLPVQIFTCQPVTGALTWVNTKYIVYRGINPQAILLDPWQGIHPDDRVGFRENFDKCLANGQQFSHKARLRRFDGSWRWFFSRASPLRDKRQRIVHWAGTNMDIHEQHLAEMSASKQQETAASEAKYRALANSSPQIVFAVNDARGVTFCNSQWTIYSGQTEEQASGIGFMDFVHPLDIAKCKLPTFSEDGTITTDAPTSVPPEIHRNNSNRSSDESSEGAKTVTSPTLVSPSPAATPVPQARLSKLTSAGILKVSRDLDGRPSYSTEVRLRSKEGTFRWHLVRVLQADSVRIGDVDEESTWYGTCTDINDHKVLEQTLKDTMDAKSRFLSNMSHEIRTPLNGITGMVNFLIDSNLTMEQMEHVNIIRNSTEGLRDLINDILDLSKVEAGMINLQQEWMHVRTLIEEVNDLTSALSIDKGLELNYTIEDDVPDIVKGDRFRIRQVLLNVVGNAIKFTQVGEVFVRCSLTEYKAVEGETPNPLKEHETVLRFDIIDTGAGFTEEEARFLFKRFSQIDSSSTKQHGGTGLGLAISMQLVELHGGVMTATSQPGQGSCFTFTVRFVLPSEQDHPATLQSAEPGVRSRISTPAVLPARPALSKAPSPINSPPIVALKRSDTESPAESVRTQHSTSSDNSDPSVRTAQTSAGSGISATASLIADQAAFGGAIMTLALPTKSRSMNLSGDTMTSSSQDGEENVRTPTAARMLKTPLTTQASMFSILLVCPMKHAREATAKHIEMTIPRSSPHHITSRANIADCHRMFSDTEPVIFTHVVLILRSVPDISTFLARLFTSPAHSRTNVIVLTDLAQKRDVIAQPAAKKFNYTALQEAHRLSFVFKPSKPSKFTRVFDPRREGDMAQDRSQDNAQQVAVSQKQVFEDVKRRLGGRGLKILLVEDNKTNQMVLQKFLKKVDILCHCVSDGQEATDHIFATTPPDQPTLPHQYSIILCDLHMPNKDGYQTCKEIRRWERKTKRKFSLPIVALSANVLGDVFEKCEDAGFNGYVTKPVDFKELGSVLTWFLDGEGKDVIRGEEGKGGMKQRFVNKQK